MRTVWAFELVFPSVGPLPDLASLDPTSTSCAGRGDRNLRKRHSATTPNFEQPSTRLARIMKNNLHFPTMSQLIVKNLFALKSNILMNNPA
ncbi:hypothetical protein Pla52n_68070 [Stieleria varia]|uniref:Uncharacterized protein n=1 Tax=Stieleria varia TaxID=2528005 RepID=A0A5C5ZRK1_9BACT|nr:hypothetical protein Pla52n_68070 [Stieleria varia]